MGLFNKKTKNEDSDKIDIKVSGQSEKNAPKKADVESVKEVQEIKEVKEVKKEKKSKAVEKASPKKAKEEKTDSKKDTKEAYKYLLKPLISEKVAMQGALNQYGFEVSKRATKVEIKKAIKALYGADVEKVNIINVRGKKVKHGRKEGSRKSWKKAIVSVKEGQKVELYEGV
jgi:large subunit ribosomal protein L23